MVVAIVGTHGSGKSTLMTRVVESYSQVDPVFAAFSRLPAVTICSSAGSQQVAVIGAYGGGHQSGLDSGRFAGLIETVFGWVLAQSAEGRHVLYEGALACSAWARLVALPSSVSPTLAVLTTPVDECIASLRARKAERLASGRRHKNSQRPVDSAVVRAKHRAVCAAAAKVRATGCRVIEGDREGLLRQILEALA